MNDQSRVSSWAMAVCRWVLVLLTACAGVFGTQAALAASASSAPSEYRLGPGDILHVTVYQNPDLTLDTRVSESGMVSYPLLGTVKLGGLTVTEAERHIASGLRSGNFVKQPQVTVMVTQVHGNQASVLGQVNRPGRFPLEVGDLRLTDLLAMAGGIAPSGADEVTVVGTREGRAYHVVVDLPSLFGASSRTQDIAVQNGDVIWVDRAPMVYVYGEVQRPGAIRLERGMTVMQALAASGGLTQRGTERGMRVHRRIDGRMQEIQPKMDDAVQNGDVVYVRESIF